MTDQEHHKVGRRAGTVSLLTFFSRLTGLARDSVVAYFLGASAGADSFYVAFRLPNLFRRLTAEGALTIAFVPIFTEHLKSSREEAKKITGIVFTYLSIFLAILSVLGVIFAPYLVKMIAYGFTKDPEKFTTTVLLARVMFPYIFLISLTALAMGVLNSMKHFAAPAASPILLNIFTILTAAIFSKYLAEPELGLAAGVIVGGIAQVSLQIPMLAKYGMLPRLNFNYHHPALKKLLLLMLPAAFGAAVYQVNVLVITFLASFLPDGSVSFLWYADRVVEFPLGIFAVAIATAVLPTLSDHAANKDIESFKSTLRYGMTGALTITIPAAVGLYLLSTPIVRLLFQRGHFDSADTVGTVGALAFFVLGLPFVSAVRNIVPAFFALKDSKTPVMVSTVVLVCNAIFALLLMKPMLHRGLALAVALSNFVNFSLLLIFLRRKIGHLGLKAMVGSLARITLAASVMGVVLWYLQGYMEVFYANAKAHTLLGAVLVAVIAGAVLYMSVLKLIKAPEYKMLASVVRRRRE